MVDAQLKSLRGRGHCPRQAAFTDLSVGQTHQPGFGYYQRYYFRGWADAQTQAEQDKLAGEHECAPLFGSQP